MPRAVVPRILCVLSLLAASHGHAHAWSGDGHRIVAMIAERHLTAKAREAVVELLASAGASSMAEVAVWADQMRHLSVPREPRHTVRIPFDGDYDPDTHCRRGRCPLGSIEASVELLRAGSAPVAARSVALKYVIHFVGELHQPLHASEDPGRWEVRIGNRTTPMHRVWDRWIVRAQRTDAEELSRIVESGPPAVVEKGTPLGWAYESRDMARDVIFAKPFSRNEEGLVELPGNYYADHWPIVRQRLKQGGYRLAFLLNDIFG